METHACLTWPCTSTSHRADAENEVDDRMHEHRWGMWHHVAQDEHRREVFVRFCLVDACMAEEEGRSSAVVGTGAVDGGVGTCTETPPRISTEEGSVTGPACTLLAGHAGKHRNDEGCEWWNSMAECTALCSDIERDRDELEAEVERLRAAAHDAFALLNRAVDRDLSDQVRAVKARTLLRSALWPRQVKPHLESQVTHKCIVCDDEGVFTVDNTTYTCSCTVALTTTTTEDVDG